MRAFQRRSNDTCLSIHLAGCLAAALFACLLPAAAWAQALEEHWTGADGTYSAGSGFILGDLGRWRYVRSGDQMTTAPCNPGSRFRAGC